MIQTKDVLSQPLGSVELFKRIPYGISDYERMRRENAYYVDKTRFIPMIEAAPFYLFCIRPRRFGKSLWLSVLRHYYDLNQAENFDFLFGDTYIGRHPTTDRNSYLVLFLNFAMVSPSLADVQSSFEENIKNEIDNFLYQYQQFFTEHEIDYIQEGSGFQAKLQRIFYHTSRKNLKIYLFIDEYDNFTNTILANQGQQSYQEITHGAGFFRYFFNLLKGATGGQISGLTRLFITGVSPITMDDVTSGFNIGHNISLDGRFNEIVGLTEAELADMLHYYQRQGMVPIPIDEAMTLMKEWYNNYYFGRKVKTSMYNSDMLFHFLLKANAENGVPEQLVDPNIRTDYSKLRYLMTVDRLLEQRSARADERSMGSRQLNGNFSQLKQIIETGEAISAINDSFPVEQLLSRENFISLLYYFGLLSFAGTVDGDPLLQIPNRTVKDLLYGYMRSGFEDADVFKLDTLTLSRLLRNMAYRGEWRPFFDYLNGEIQKQASVRDHLNGEKVFQGFLIAYLNVTHHFATWSEKEMGGGFVDLYLEPFMGRYPDMKYGYLIELKYISERQFAGKEGQEKFDAKVADAENQLRRYTDDPRIQKYVDMVTFKKIALVYRGWELAHAEEVLV